MPATTRGGSSGASGSRRLLRREVAGPGNLASVEDRLGWEMLTGSGGAVLPSRAPGPHGGVGRGRLQAGASREAGSAGAGSRRGASRRDAGRARAGSAGEAPRSRRPGRTAGSAGEGSRRGPSREAARVGRGGLQAGRLAASGPHGGVGRGGQGTEASRPHPQTPAPRSRGPGKARPGRPSPGRRNSGASQRNGGACSRRRPPGRSRSQQQRGHFVGVPRAQTASQRPWFQSPDQCSPSIGPRDEARA